MKRTSELRKPFSNQALPGAAPPRSAAWSGGYANPGTFAEVLHVALVEHDVEGVEVVDESTHFNVGAPTDDDRMVAVAQQSATARCATCTNGQVASTTPRPRARTPASARSTRRAR